jgi:hypothetical protein
MTAVLKKSMSAYAAAENSSLQRKVRSGIACVGSKLCGLFDSPPKIL